MSRPLVSICVPVSGESRFLTDALVSVLEQDVDDIEVVVRAQGAANAGRVVSDLGDHRVRHYSDRTGGGVAANRNGCLALARGHYVAWLDSDDVWLTGTLADRLTVLEAHPEVAIVHGTAEILDEDGCVLAPWRRPFDRDTTESPQDAFAELLLANEVTTSSVVTRRALMEHVGGFVASGPTSSDWDMWLRLALRGAVAYRASPTVCYRQHGSSISATTSQAERLRCDSRVIRRVLAADQSLISDPPAATDRANRALAARSLLIAQDRLSLGDAVGARHHVAFAGRLAAGSLAGSLGGLFSSVSGDDPYEWHQRSRGALIALTNGLQGSRYGSWLKSRTSTDPAWEAVQSRIASTVRLVTPGSAVIATATKWDPTILHLSGRRGRQFPDRALMPEGYPVDGRQAAAHVDDLYRTGVTHLVLPRAWGWWLDRYGELRTRLGTPLHADDDCLIFDVVEQ